MTSRAALLALVAALAVAAAGCGRSAETPDTFVVGAVEDAAKSGHADAKMLLARQAGFRAIVLSAVWTPPLEAPPAAELAALENAVIAAATNGIRPIVAVYSFSSVTPTTPAARAQFAAYAASIPRLLPGVRDVIVGNEPNLNLFWLPQFGPDGSDAAAASYLALLAESYDALKDVSPDINVIGGSLSARGSDDPAGSRPTHSPTRFIEDLGAAYRASGRDKPVMDMFSIHPYPGELEHPADLRAPAEHRRSASPTTTSSSALLGAAFDGTAQPGSSLPIVYGEYGLQTAIPQQKLGRYTGRRAGDDEADRRGGPGSPICRRDRDRGLPPDGADAALLPRLGRAPARAPPDRRLLRRRHTEIEPGDDRPRGPRRPGAAPGLSALT